MVEQGVPVSQADQPAHGPSGTDSIAILQIVLTQMTVMEHRITQRMDAQAEATKNRWQTHDEQHENWERALKALGHRLDDHLKKEEREELIFDARVDPLRRGAYWLYANWKSLTIIVLALGGLLAGVSDQIADIFRR